MKLQPNLIYSTRVIRRLLSLIGAALLLLPLTAAALTGPDLAVTKVCAVNGPQSVLCTVTITHIGQGQAPSVAPLSIMDTPTAPPGSTYTGAGGSLPISCSLGAGPVLPIPCTANTSLLFGQTKTALFSFNVPQGGTFKNCVSVSQGQNLATLPDPNPANNTNVCTSINVPGPSGGGPITVITPPPTGACTSSIPVINLHYPNQSCAQTTPGFLAGMMTSFHFKSKCTAPNTLLGVTNVSCQNAPIPGFPNGSVYQGTACCGMVPPPSGTLTVTKRIINNNAGIATPGPFQVNVNCSPNGPNQTVSLTGPNFQQVVNNIPAGSACTINELAPVPPPGCEWITTYPNPNGQTGKVGDNLVVKNELLCKGGSVTVIKQIVNVTGIATPPGPYQVSVSCNPNVPNTTVSLISPNSLQQVVNLPAGSASCKFEELTPKAPDGCKWITTYPNGQSGQIGDKLVVKNELKCELPPGGKLTIVKKIINNNAGITTPGPFEVQVKCNPNVPYSSVSLTGPSFQYSINLPAGGNCKIEEVPPKAPPGCTWVTTYPSGQAGKVGDTLVVKNELKCESCPRGQAEMTFPGTDTKYCCEGKPGNDKFCCNRKN